jgi:hypothetical protein
MVFGAALSGVLIPLFMRRWQNRQKELELKASLVSEMSQSIMTMLVAIRSFHQSGADPDKTRELEQVSREWQIQNAITGTKLKAYFPAKDDKDISDTWRVFADIVTEFAFLHSKTRDQQKTLMAGLAQRLSTLIKPKVTKDWEGLMEAIYKSKSMLIRKVLKERFPVFSYRYKRENDLQEEPEPHEELKSDNLPKEPNYHAPIS